MTFISLDYETADSRGASTDFFRPDFRVTSLSLTTKKGDRLISKFYDTPDSIKKALQWLDKHQLPIIVHNLQFELGVTLSCYPELNLNWQYDTMRLAGLRDSGGTPKQIKQHASQSLGAFLTEAQAEKRIGLGLTKCASRFLPPQYHNHKSEAHTWLEQNCGIHAHHGRHLDKLPRDILERYNVADTEITYLLWEDCLAYLESIGFSDRVDWQLYHPRMEHFSRSKLVGFVIDRPKLLEYIIKLEQDVNSIDEEFLAWCGPDLDNYKHFRILRDIQSKRIKEKNQFRAFKSRWLSDKFDFNPNSSTQFSEFLMEFRGIKPVIYTKPAKNRKSKTEFKPRPSTAAHDMHQWGEAGAIMDRKSKLQIKLNQAMGIYLASEFDGRWHPDVKTSTTATDRVKGGNDE